MIRIGDLPVGTILDLPHTEGTLERISRRRWRHMMESPLKRNQVPFAVLNPITLEPIGGYALPQDLEIEEPDYHFDPRMN